jgi:hypothetical protein
VASHIHIPNFHLLTDIPQNNLLSFGFLMLWVRGWFWLAELLLIINLFNLTALYFRHPTTPRFVHIPVVSGPYAWNYVAILWTGAAMVHAHSLAARILANIAIWGILVLGVFFLLVFKDYTMGFELAVLSLCKFAIHPTNPSLELVELINLVQRWRLRSWPPMSWPFSGSSLSSSWLV